MEPRKELFAIVFNPRHHLLEVSLVVECGLGGGGRPRAAAPRQTQARKHTRDRCKLMRDRLARRGRTAHARAAEPASLREAAPDN